MRILLVIDHLGIGGAQRQLANLALGLRQSGCAVDIFVYHAAADFEADLVAGGVGVVRNLKRWRYSISPVTRLARQLRRGAYDVALAYLYTPSFYLELASIASPATRVVVSERSQFPPGRLSIRRRVLESFHRLADCVVANSHTHAQRLEREFPWMCERIRVIYNGVKPTLFDVSKRPETRQDLNLLAVSTVVPIKNALSVAYALGACLRQGLDVRVRWAGRHPDQSKQYIEQVNRTLEQAGARDNWTWLGERSDVPELLAEADAVIHPSLVEGFPNSVCEAMAASRPVLASNIGDIPRLVGDGEAGFLFDPEDAGQIAESIRRLCAASPAERRRLGEQGRALARQNWTVEKTSARYIELFESLRRSDAPLGQSRSPE